LGKGYIEIMKNPPEDETFLVKISVADLYRRILINLYRNQETNIVNLSHEIGIDISYLTPALRFLENAGFVDLCGKTVAEELSKISLREWKNYIIGLDLGGTKLYGAISDITGNIVYEEEIKNHGKSGEACFEMLAHLIGLLINKAQEEKLNLIGIGIDVPGRVQLETGVVINAPAVGMKDYPLKDRLVSKFGYPVYIDNDLKQAALGEAWFGTGKDYRSVVLLAIGTGIAASCVVDGNLLRGAHLRYGELGWSLPGRDYLGRRYVGFGAFETEAAGPGIEKRAKQILSGKVDAKTLEEVTAKSVFEAAKKGEAWAEQCLAEIIEFFAVLIANIMAFYDPDIIVLSGGVGQSGDMLISPIMKRIEGCVLTQPYIVSSTLGYKAGVLGAIINLVQNCPELFE
jgi:glucokinase